MRIHYFGIAMALLAPLAMGETKIASVAPTPQQLLIAVSTDQPGNCVYRVSEGTSFAAPVNDVNEALFRGSSSDARPGALIEARTHTFVAGTRIAQKAADNKWYSRSLQTNTPHWIGVKCGADAEVSLVFSTTNKPLGNTWAEPYPYDEAAPLGYAWPTVDFNDKAKAYVDPETGILLKRATGLDDSRDDGAPAEPTQAAFAVYAVKRGDWRNPEGAGKKLVVSASTTPLFVALAGITIGYSTARLPSWDPGLSTEPISDVKVRITGFSTGGFATGSASGGANAALCLSVNGTSCATDMHPVTLPVSKGSVDYPAGAMIGYFSEWIGSTVAVPLSSYDIATFTGTVNVAGNQVTWNSGNKFNVSAWSAGSHIRLAAGPASSQVSSQVSSQTSGACTPGDYAIAAVNSDTSLTLAANIGNCANASYTAANFGLLIFPRNSASVSISEVRFTWDEHPSFTNPASGANDYCNRTQVSDPSGVRGWICYLGNTGGGMSVYFVPSALDAPGAKTHLLASRMVPANADASIDYERSPEDQTRYAILSTFSGGIPSDVSDPNSFYALARNNDNSKLSLIKGTYQPKGVHGKCTDPAAYSDYAPANSMAQNCNVTWVNLTRASSPGKTLTDRMVAFDARFDPNYFVNVQIVGVRNGTIIIGAITQQDLLGWAVFVNASTGEVTAMWPTYANFPTRWSGIHSFVDQGDPQHIPVITQNLYGCTNNGCGAYEVNVIAANGATGSVLAAAPGGACTGVTDPKVKDLLAYGDGCVELTLAGMDACDTTPSPYELANFPACSWNPNYRGLKWTSATAGDGQKIEVGDAAFDPTCTGSCELMLVVQLTGGNRVKVLRNFGLPHGPALDDNKRSTLQPHAPNFVLRFTAGMPGLGCEIWGNFATDRHGENLRCDATYFPTSHSDHVGPVSVLTAYYGKSNRLAYSVRTGQGSSIDQIGKKESVSVQTGVGFGGVQGAGHHLGPAWESHPSYRQTAAAPGEQQWFLDVVRMGESGNPLYTGAKVTHIAGDLYRIAGFPAFGSLNIKYRPLLVWAGRHNMTDKSGPKSTIGGSAADRWQYCYAYLAGECVPAAAPGSMYMNVPSATTDGACLPTPAANSLCVTVVSPELDAVSQIGFAHAYTNGELARTLAVPFRPWFASNVFSNAHSTPDGTGAIFTCDWCAGVRSDLWWAKVPPLPAVDNVNRSDYVNRPVNISGVPGSAVRIRFGYAENGPAEALYCTTRREACATGGKPFLFLSEPQQFTRCETNCVVNVPTVPGRVVYYVVDRQRNGVVTSEPLRALAVN